MTVYRSKYFVISFVLSIKLLWDVQCALYKMLIIMGTQSRTTNPLCIFIISKIISSTVQDDDCLPRRRCNRQSAARTSGFPPKLVRRGCSSSRPSLLLNRSISHCRCCMPQSHRDPWWTTTIVVSNKIMAYTEEQKKGLQRGWQPPREGEREQQS